MNSLQAKEFELLNIFVDICEKLNLKYFLVCGSALGAVKYNGFIPWDDDVDVALVREDYEIFLDKAQEYLPSNIFLQNYRTDKEYPGLGSKLRDSNTTFIEKEALKFNINHGVYIDIFPLDGYPVNTDEQKAFEKNKWHYYRRRYVRLNPFVHRDIGLTITSLLYRVFGAFSNTSTACRKIEEIQKSIDFDKSEYWCNYANSMFKAEYVKKDIYGNGKMVLFEGKEMRVPEKYEEYLTSKYGDYKKDPPLEKQKATHGYIVDLDNSYTKYLGGNK